MVDILTSLDNVDLVAKELGCATHPVVVLTGRGVMTAPEILTSLHTVDSSKEGVPLKRVMAGLDACMREEQRQAFPPEAMAVALQQLVTRSASVCSHALLSLGVNDERPDWAVTAA